MANHLLISPLHLIQSELGQKEEAEPRSRRERCQGCAAMRSREVASFPIQMGWPLGRFCERASVLRAKFVSLTSSGIQDRAHSVSPALAEKVIPAITSRKRNIHSTDEVPRRPGLRDQVSSGYKPDAKGPSQASEMGTASPRPHPKGCQQRQSRNDRSNPTRSQRLNLSVPAGSTPHMGKVSQAVQAPKWPERTSSSQPAPSLRNMPQQRSGRRQAVRQHEEKSAWPYSLSPFQKHTPSLGG